MLRTRRSSTPLARRRSGSRALQLTIFRRGGARPGAGRKSSREKPLVSHRARPTLTAHLPVLVTIKLERGLPSLRQPMTRTLLHAALRIGGQRHGMRVVHFSIQSNHVHLLVEANDTPSLSRGMQGLGVRIARSLNRAWNRKGSVFADRYHARVLRTPREVRYALAYVIHNARKHGLRIAGIDAYSSGASFDGWRIAPQPHPSARALPVAPARSWLLRVGWRRHGRIEITEVPGGK